MSERNPIYVVIQMKSFMDDEKAQIVSLQPWEAYTVEAAALTRCEGLNRQESVNGSGVSYHYQKVSVDRYAVTSFVVTFDWTTASWKAEPDLGQTPDSAYSIHPIIDGCCWSWYVKTSTRADAIRVTKTHCEHAIHFSR